MKNNDHDVPDISGLELLKAMVERKYPMPSMAETIPMAIISAEPGIIQFSAKAGMQHLNPLGGVHGGFASTVLDSVTGCAVHSLLEAGVGYATVDLNIKMLKPVPRDFKLIAIGKVIHISRNLGVSEGTLKDEEGNLYAHATATCMILRQ
jgi:uncharacterized protein (TIGR00369 family)